MGLVVPAPTLAVVEGRRAGGGGGPLGRGRRPGPVGGAAGRSGQRTQGKRKARPGGDGPSCHKSCLTGRR